MRQVLFVNICHTNKKHLGTTCTLCTAYFSALVFVYKGISMVYL